MSLLKPLILIIIIKYYQITRRHHMKRNTMKRYQIAGFILAVILIITAGVYAAGQSSASYTIESDVLSTGGSSAGSATYLNEDTLGQSSAIGRSTSSSYGNYGGFWYTIWGGACPNLPVRIVRGVPLYYMTLQDAYIAAGAGEVIQSQNIMFTEDLNIDLNKEVTITGGYSCDYANASGTTSIRGTLSIISGLVSIENLVVAQ
jgi:hypothetical protein